MSTITITLPDGSQRSVPRARRCGSLPRRCCRRASIKKALAATVDGQHGRSDLPARRTTRRCKLVTPDGPEALPLYRHSTAHLLAAAVTQLFPGAQCGIGPATDEGFFYDFVVPRPFVPEDLEKIEAKMRELARAGSAVRAADVAARGSDRVLHASAASRSRSS